METNYTLILAAAVAQFVLGALWYSPLLFGKHWMKIMGADSCSPEELRAMQKSMMPFYALQLLLSILTTFTLWMFIYYLGMAGVGFHAYGVAGWIWLGFIAPTQVACVIWANTKKQYWLKQISIMLSYQLIAAMLAAYILSL
jgi:hypothetical protein